MPGVGQTLANDGEDVVAQVLGYRIVHGSLEPDLGPDPQAVRQLFGQLQHGLTEPTGKCGLAELEDGRSNLADREVELVDRPCDPLDHLIPLGQPRCALEVHADGVDTLDHPVVEVTSDPVPIVEHGHHEDAVVQAVVLDGKSRREGQRLGEGLVFIGKGRFALLVRQVEVAVDLVAHPHRDTEERRHGRVIGRKTITAGVFLEVGEPEGSWFRDEQTEDAAPDRPIADLRLFFVAQPDGEELLEAGPGGIEHPEGGIAGSDQRPGLLDQVAEQIGQLDVGGDHEHRPHEPSQLLRIVQHACRAPRGAS